MITCMMKADCAKEWDITKLIVLKAISDPEQKAIITSLAESLTIKRKDIILRISVKGMSVYQVDEANKLIDDYLKDYITFVLHSHRSLSS